MDRWPCCNIGPHNCLQIDFPTTNRAKLESFVLKVRQETFDVSYLFANDPALVEQYGPTPFITELGLQYRVSVSMVVHAQTGTSSLAVCCFVLTVTWRQ